ncbi:hypothetical protein DL89DRAFT_263781 [Linderina pennispora]|uniref:TLC domain-containing protein n=1 Tax=Linderina pennispora TaxID=61395 RepID=A0A1Y1WJQ7_9FUNG|nr:uncharacterized protein DL89DRAFT_263781 [Linderina pennispora]ORX73767.1 hypothetical protein DL89DRAFT_263781 [Linderina pennispora]
MAAAAFQLIYLVVGMLTSLIFSGMWARLTKVQKYKWCVRKASIAHAVFIVTQALVIIANMDLRRDPVHGTDPVAEKAFTVTNLHVNGWGFMIPRCAYYGACFMMFEVSTIFLNIHLGLNDLGWTDYVVSSFFFARLVYGTMLTINVWRELRNTTIPISPLASAYIRLSNLVLLTMSYYWFYLIIKETKNTMDKKEKKEKA